MSEPELRRAYRSDEETTMRLLVAARLRADYPGARIVHELGLRYSARRIDVAAVTVDQIVAAEIKSSRDVTDRLEEQIRGFTPIASLVIVALAPVWNEQLACEVRPNALGTSYVRRFTECQSIIERCRNDLGEIETWTVDAEAGTITATRKAYRRNEWPWPAAMLHILHVDELREIAARHRIVCPKRPNHKDLWTRCAELMTGREIRAAVCRALRERPAFDKASDAPILQVAA